MTRPPGPPPGSLKHGHIGGVTYHQENGQLFYTQPNNPTSGFTRSAVQQSHAGLQKPIKVQEGLPTPSEDEDEEDEYSRAEQFKDDDDPDADMDLDEQPTSLSHPPIVTAQDEEEDELFSLPVAPPPHAPVDSEYGRHDPSKNEVFQGLPLTASTPSEAHTPSHAWTQQHVSLPQPIRQFHAGGALSVLETHMRRDPNSPSRSPHLPAQNPQIPRIDFYAREVHSQSKQFQQASIQGAREYNAKAMVVPSRPSSTGLAMQRPMSTRLLSTGLAMQRPMSTHPLIPTQPLVNPRPRSQPLSAASSMDPQTSAEHSDYPARVFTTPPLKHPSQRPQMLVVDSQGFQLSEQAKAPMSRPPLRPSTTHHETLRPSSVAPHVPSKWTGNLPSQASILRRPLSTVTTTLRPSSVCPEAQTPSLPAAPVPVLQVTVPSPIGLSAMKDPSLAEGAPIQSSNASGMLELPSTHPPSIGVGSTTNLSSERIDSLPGSSSIVLSLPSSHPEAVPSSVADPQNVNDISTELLTHTNVMQIKVTGRPDQPEPSEQRGGRMSTETVSQIEEASAKIWDIINQATRMNPALTATHIINHAFPVLGAHKMTYWNIFLAKYKAKHSKEAWNSDRAQWEYKEFKNAFPGSEWKEILDEYMKVMDLDAGYMARSKRQTIFRSAFTELSKQLDYHARRNGFEGILAFVGANPTNDGPSMVAFHETELAQGFADQKLHLKNDWAVTHLRTYVQNRKSDMVIELHRQEVEPQHDENVILTPQHGRDSSSLPYVESTANALKSDDGNRKMDFVPFKILRPNDPKSAQTSCTVNLCAMMAFYEVPMRMKAPQNTHENYPDYRQCPWKRLGKPLQEHNMLLVGWPPSLPLPINDENNPTSLSKGASSLSDSQKIRLAKALEESEIRMIQGPATGTGDIDEFIFVRTTVDTAISTYYEAIYCAATELSMSRATRVTARPVEADSNRPQTRQNSKINARNGNQSNQTAGEKRTRATVMFEDPTSNDQDEVPVSTRKKRRKNGGNRSKKHKEDGNKGNTVDRAMPTRTSHTVQASMDLPTLPRKSHQDLNQITTVEHQKQPKPRPMYKAKTSQPGPSAFESRADVGQHTHSALRTGSQSNAGAASSLNVVQQHTHTLGHNTHEFQDFPGRRDLPGYGYIDIQDDDVPGSSSLYDGMAAWPEPSDDGMSYYNGGDNMPFGQQWTSQD
ncbi:hypothetical protein EDD85DRAFT_943302 [Armillaria nabsnona]|nr:hypothetical protein EDD85DRAFT_943302 [Armillaria nabsnona]